MCVPRVAVPLCIAGLCVPAAAQHVSTFDALPEGGIGTVYVDGPLTFSDGDQRIPGSNPPYTLVADDATGGLGGFSGFSAPNVLMMGGYSPGPGTGGSRFGLIRITPSEPCIAASIDVFEFGSDGGNTVVFAAYEGGQEVARTTSVMPGGFSFHHFHMTLSGVTFDELRLFGEGPSDLGVFFGSLDNVAVEFAGGTACYANCDESTTEPVLNVADFGCFLQRFGAGDAYANCDGSTAEPTLNVADFTCFLQEFAAGCD